MAGNDQPVDALPKIISWPRAILHLDMDAFYVNVHVLDNPHDAGLPLVIGGRPHERGVVASASYEARRLGIRSAMPASTAISLCPTLKIVVASWPRTRECSQRVMAVLADYGPVEQVSVDEAYVELIHWADPRPLARAVQTAVKTTTQLPASVGLATSKLVAKVASDYEKPEGCTLVLPGQEAAFLAPLPVRAIWGIGPRTAERLAALGITTCSELAAADLTTLRAHFGRQADGLQRRALGIDERPVQAERSQPKSISQACPEPGRGKWTFSQDVNDPAPLRAELRRQGESVAQSLQRRSLVAHTVRVKFRWADFTTFTRQKSVARPIDDAAAIYRLALAIWQEHWPAGQRMRLIGVGVTGLETAAQRRLGLPFDEES
jgi:DNA polymerase IV